MNPLIRLLGYLKSKRALLVLAFIILMAAAAADMSGPILIKVFIDDFLTQQRFDRIPMVLLCSGYIVLLLTASIFNYLQFYFFQKIALSVIQKLRVDVFAHVQRLSMTYFDNFPVGGLVSRITNDTETIKILFSDVLTTFFKNGIFILWIFIAMLFLNLKLGLICLAIVPIIAVLIFYYGKLSSKVIGIVRRQLSDLNAFINESLQGMGIIQAFVQEKRKISDFETINQTYYKYSIGSIRLNSLMCWSAVDLLSTLILAFILYIFVITSHSHIVEIGVLYAFINYVFRFFEPIKGIMQRLVQFQTALVSARRVFELLDEPLEPQKKIGNRSPVIIEGLVEFKNISFSYDSKVYALKDISFKANPGQTVAFVGHTGSGKSTVVNLLMRFYRPQTGEILIDGIPLCEYDIDELCSKTGLVLQDSFLFTGNIKDNIGLHKERFSESDIKNAAKYVCAHQFIEKLNLGYSEKVAERGVTLSGGQRQLISFARAIVNKPKILILDEATAHVDTETEYAIQDAMGRMRKGRTTIIIAHRLSTIQDADRIIVLHRGEIAEQGTHNELLMQKGLYYKMFLLQQG